MLKSLHVSNYVLIDSLDITFPGGLVIISGQTGAGKSILLGSLSLALGGKSDPSMVGESSDTCVVEATFEAGGDPLLAGIFRENDLQMDGGRIVLRRVLGRSGRSRSFVNDEPVKVAVLSRMASRLVDIHSQHQTMLLSDRSFQLGILDNYAHNADLLEQCRQSYSALQHMKSELLSITAKIQTSVRERDYNKASFDKLDAARLRPGEMEELEAEQRQLANVETIKENLVGIENLLDSDSGEGSPSVDAALREGVKLLTRTSSFIPSCGSLAERMESVRLELEDILSEVNGMESSVEVSPQRLEQVEDRMGELYDLMKKHSCSSVEELIAVRDALGSTLYDTEELEQRRSDLQREIEKEGERHASICASLHESRLRCSKEFSRTMQESIRSLELDKAVFDVQLLPCTPGAEGADTVLFRFSSTGRNPQDIAGCASGGEASRIMLCLKAMMAKYTRMPSLVFDEIDTGVSGSAADKMGQMICAMGRDMQIFAITHLPQVAAKGSAHYLVSKRDDSQRTYTTITPLDEEGRLREIARMLSGSTITPEALSNARSLLLG